MAVIFRRDGRENIRAHGVPVSYRAQLSRCRRKTIRRTEKSSFGVFTDDAVSLPERIPPLKIIFYPGKPHGRLEL